MATSLEPAKRGGKNYYRIWHTLFEIDKKYVPIEPIGRGAYGVVCSSLNVETNERVAIKKISNVFENNTYALRTLRELILLRCIKEHGNVIALKDVLIPTDLRRFNDVYLVYELMNTDLHQIIYNSPTPLSNEECRYFLWQILRGLKYLHSANVLHRDLKPANLLVKKNSDLKICDFGLARSNREQGKPMTEYVVTRWYRAPELLLSCDNYGPSIDMWSAGCIFAEILGRKPLFQGTDSLNQLKLIISVLGGQPDSNLEFIDKPRVKSFVQSLNSYPETHFSSLFPQADPLALDLLSRMLVFDPSKRITATEALDHPYITTLYDPDCSPEAEFHVDVDHIDESVGEPILRELMLKEILHHHPQAADGSVLC